MPAKSEVTILRAAPPPLKAYLQKVWAYRSMIFTLARRDLKVRYAQTFLGLLWAGLQPLTGLLIFTFFFTRLIQLDTALPYPLIALSGMAAWYFFSNMIYSAGQSLVEAQDLIKKVYFPRLILLLAKVLTGLVDLAISTALLFLLMLLMGVFPGPQIIFFPLLVLLNIAVGLSVSLWLSALTLRYRDFHHIIPYLVNYGIWLTPVFFPTTLIPENFKWLLYLNPMAAVITGFRWSLIGDVFPVWFYWISFFPVLVLLFTGLNYFRKIENKISDYV